MFRKSDCNLINAINTAYSWACVIHALWQKRKLTGHACEFTFLKNLQKNSACMENFQDKDYAKSAANIELTALVLSGAAQKQRLRTWPTLALCWRKVKQS